MEDPWDWDVDQVVRALCYRQSHLLGSDDYPKEFPKPDELESILRSNSVGGLALLTDVNNKTMREDLEIKQFGHRSAISHLIQILRRHSPKWLAYYHTSTADNFTPGRSGTSNAKPESELASFVTSPPPLARGNLAQGPLISNAEIEPTNRTQSWIQGQDGHITGPSPGRSSFDQSHYHALQEAPVLPQPDSSSTIEANIPVAEGAIGGNVCEVADNPGLYTLGGPQDEARIPNEVAQAMEVHSVAWMRDRQGETIIVDQQGRKRRKLILTPLEPVLAPETNTIREAEIISAIPTPPGEEPYIDQLQNANQLQKVDERDLNNLVTAEMSLVIEAPKSPPHELPEPGTIIRNEEGRKRMRPILLSQPEEAMDSSIHQVQSTSTHSLSFEGTSPRPGLGGSLSKSDIENSRSRNDRAANQTYCGTMAFPIDNVFYGATAFGQPLETDVNLARPMPGNGVLDHPENFVDLSQNHVSCGHRLYVNSQIRYFLQSSQFKVLEHGDKNAYALIPYPDKFFRKHQPLSITEFRKSSDGYTVSRQNRSRLASASLVSAPGVDSDANLFNMPEVSGTEIATDTGELDFLEKWKYLDGEDKVLPLFGDSGSEGEYDLETWREMENEQGTLTRSSASSRRQTIAHADVQAAIDEATEQLREDWRSKRLPKLQRRGWRIWITCIKNGFRQQRLRELMSSLTGLEMRLAGLRNEILKEAWSSQQQVTKQCKILQPSIFDNEDCKWEMSILRLKKPPQKPVPILGRPRYKKIEDRNEPLKDGEEALESDDSANYDSQDDLGGFVVDDEDATTDMTDANLEGMTTDHEDAPMDITDEDQTVAGFDDERPSGISARDSTLASSPTPKNLSNTDVDPPAPHSPKKFKKEMPSKREPICIDLTQASDPIDPVECLSKPEPISPTIRTPPLKAQDSSSDESRGLHRKLTSFRRPQIPTEIIELESDTCEEDEMSIVRSPLPNLQDYAKICRLSVKLLEERQDRKRLLIWTLSKYKETQRQAALAIIRAHSFHDVRVHVWKALGTYKAHGWRIRGYETEFSDSLMLIAAFYVCWTIPVRLDPKGGIRVDHLETTITDGEGFDPFYHFLVECLSRFEAFSDLDATQQELEDVTPTKKRIKTVSQEDEQSSYATPNKKRKHVVQESQEAVSQRIHAQSRAQALERRKKTLKLRQQKMGYNDEDPSTIVVNPGKEENQEFIYLNPKIGERIQPHQKDGVQFMWRELTADPENLQGCLLAHTMGLGKTMQVITVLVTIAEAARSANASIRGQVPKPLRTSQTLVLCPPSLVENWYEEFLMWAPDPMEDNVGDVRKVTSAMSLPDRIAEITTWTDVGGVLLMGFNAFRAFIGNVSKNLAANEYSNILDALLQKPNLIVADEAHTAKSLKSKLNVAMKRFRATSRIGLTGSPLANNLDEYYALIDWVAPNYLGDHVQFKAHYAEPIQQGFYKDSTAADYLESRKRLKALITDLDPKVNRADISVLRGKLKPKTEFLIKTPLTGLQSDLYRGYVDWMLDVVRKEEPKSALLWTWLEELRLLCNHPRCYKEGLEQKLVTPKEGTEGVDARNPMKQKSKAKRQNIDKDMIDSEDDLEILDGAAGAEGPQAPSLLIEKQLEIMKQNGPISSINLANKMVILDQILTFAEEANDGTLVFSHSIKTLNYIENRLRKKGKKFLRIDGSVKTTNRQPITKEFNSGSVKVCLISTRAGGQGLNLFGANRVVIMDISFNPTWEEQAVGRAYRIGQKKPVYVYRLTVGGTFEEALLNQSVFKQQLATRVVDKKNPLRYATRGAKQYLFRPKDLEQKDLASFVGKDLFVLDRLLDKYKE